MKPIAGLVLTGVMVAAFPVVALADTSPPTLVAQHYLVGDPLYSLEGVNGELFSALPDDPTQMASTTKIVTLHVAVDALMGRIPGACASSPAGFCTLGDSVTISNNAVAFSPWVPCGSLMGGCSSLMGDANGEPLVLDADQDGAFGSGDSVLRGVTPTGGTSLAVDPKLRYVELGSDGVFSAGDRIVSDTNLNGTYDQGERVFFGPAPAVGTALADDPRIRFVDTYDLGTWNSYVPLQPGEKVLFADLLRGMMYPSGNDAAIAIAEHVAGDVQTFVQLMNTVTQPGHVTTVGLANSHFTNPAGLDDFCPTVDAYGVPQDIEKLTCDDAFRKNGFIHYTTARDLARIWNHAFPDQLFRQVVGFQGTYSFSTTLGGVQKQYSYGWPPGFGKYPGFTGLKGGGTTGCGVCLIMSARRIGRQLILAFMQGSLSSPNDATAAFDYGFAKLFHPDPRVTTSLGSGWIDQSTSCLANGRAVTATMGPSYGVRLTSWGVDVDGSQLTALGHADDAVARSASPVSLAHSLMSARLSDTAILTGKTLGPLTLDGSSQGSTARLSLWSIGGSGAPTLAGDDVPAGAGSGLRLLPVQSDLFVSAIVRPDGIVALRSWRVAQEKSGPKLVPLASVDATVAAADEFAIAGTFVVGAKYYFVLAPRFTSAGAFSTQLWSLDPVGGALTMVTGTNATLVAAHATLSMIPVEPRLPDDEIFTPIYFAVGTRDAAGGLRLRYLRITFDFSGLSGYTFAGDSGNSDTILDGPTLVPFGTSGVASIVKDAASRERIIVWESRRGSDDTITPLRIAEHQMPDLAPSNLAGCALPTAHAEGDVLSASLATGNGMDHALLLRTYRIADRP